MKYKISNPVHVSELTDEDSFPKSSTGKFRLIMEGSANLFSVTTQGEIQKNPLKLTSTTVYIEAKLQAIPIIISLPKIIVKIRFLQIQTRYSTFKEMTEKVDHSRTNFRHLDTTSQAKLKKGFDHRLPSSDSNCALILQSFFYIFPKFVENNSPNKQTKYYI